MGESLSELLGKSLQLTPEQLREAQARAKQELEDEAKGKRRPVGKSPDFTRIAALDSRPWNYYQQDEFVDAVTQTLRTPEGEMRLRPVQAAALIEAQRSLESGGNGIAALMGVGSGKALVSMLLGPVMNSKCTVLLVPPSLVEQTTRVYNQMRKHWQVQPSAGFHIVSYSTLSSPKRGDILEKIKPDLIVADEASKLKNKSSTCTKRVLQHLRVFKPRFCILSGTITGRSLKDFQHLFYWVLRDRSPVPAHWPTLTEWCDALDSNVNERMRRPAGVILNFKNSDFETPREAFRNRMVSTMGIVATSADRIGTSLTFRRRELKVSPSVAVAMDQIEESWERPDGEAFADALDLAAVQRELSCGFWYKWLWPNGVVDEEWLTARKNWNKAVRDRLRRSGPGMDSPLLLFNAAQRWFQHDLKNNGPRWETPYFEPWAKVKDRPAPPSQAQWVDEYFLIDDAVAWGNDRSADEGPGIIWYAHQAVGEKIAERGRFPLYGPGKKASSEILDEKGNRTIVVSMHAHSEGKNLQHAFWRNLITTPPASGKIMEQLVGRTHREGQPSDEVVVDLYLHTECFQNAFRQARRDAVYMEDITGNPQKLVYGAVAFDGF